MTRSVLAICLAILPMVPALSANQTTTFQLSAGATDTAGEAVKANVIFDINSFGTLTVTLQNQVLNEVSVGQAISGIEFTLSNLTGSAAITSSNGTLINVAGNGSFPAGVSSSLTGWSASTSLTDVIATALGGGQPKQTILGAPTTSGTYASANASIAGNGPHNAFVEQIATFTFANLAGVNLSTVVSAVKIGFGTAGSNYIQATAVTSAVPEPGTLMLAGCAIALAAGLKRRRGAPRI